ncbi:RNA 2'-phosphotransferase [Sulfitobacter sp.]|uniref:RNA 2'-phosphotransferase n=1 Tax=unclassified Sulfitobacter TaxID=196795 RepID=UPI003565C557
MGLQPLEPPTWLCHGTAQDNLGLLFKDGRRPLRRNPVHLSSYPITASVAGSRNGKPVVLRVAAQEMFEATDQLFMIDNDVRLAGHVPPSILAFGGIESGS